MGDLTVIDTAIEMPKASEITEATQKITAPANIRLSMTNDANVLDSQYNTVQSSNNKFVNITKFELNFVSMNAKV